MSRLLEGKLSIPLDLITSVNYKTLVATSIKERNHSNSTWSMLNQK